METIACPISRDLVAVPPSSPRVISEDGHIDTTGAVAGVYQEDEPMRLKCEVVGGKSKKRHPRMWLPGFIDTKMFLMREDWSRAS